MPSARYLSDMHPQFLREHRTWLAAQLPNTTEQLVVAFAVFLPMRMKSLVALRVKDVWKEEQMLPFLASTTGQEGREVRLPLPESLADLVAAQVSRKSEDDFLFVDETGRHIDSSYLRLLLLSLGLLGRCGSEAMRNYFGIAVNMASGRKVTEHLRRSELWLWSDRELAEADAAALAEPCAALHMSSAAVPNEGDDYDQGWRLIYGLRRPETAEQRLLSAEYFLRCTLWGEKREADAIAAMLGREYPDELYELWKRGMVARYSQVSPSVDAVAVSRPRDLVEFWADVPEHLRLYGLIESPDES